MRVTEVTDTVERCVCRQDGGWLVTTRKGNHGVALEQIPIGSSVVIKDGKAERKFQ